MSYTEIIDGSGDGYRASVDNKKRLQTKAVSVPNIAIVAQDEENAYVLSSGFISLTTTGSFNGLMFIKGLNSDKEFHIERIRVCGNGTMNDAVQVKMIGNATAGTLISDANDAYSHNTTLGSSNSMEGDFAYYTASGDGKTITDGDWFAQFQQPSIGHSHQDYDGSIVISKDTSLAIEAKPEIACEICIEILGYVKNI